MKGLWILLCVGAVLFLTECGPRATNSASSSLPSGTPIPTPNPTPVTLTDPYPFEVIVTSQYDNSTGPSGPITTEVDCQMPAASVAGTINACNVAIPEARLHFSTLTWTVIAGVQPLSPPCEVVVFAPYFYQASNAAGFFPSWVTSAVDCSVSPISASCFSGPATMIIPDFPLHSSMYYSAEISSTQAYTARSANSQGRISNRWTVNNLAAGSRGGNITFLNGSDAYLANTFQDYLFTCNDRYMQPVYTFTMALTKIDISGGPNAPGNPAINQFPDWDPASWDR